LLSLARVFKKSLATIPSKVPYLQAPADGPCIGLVWAGKPTHKNIRNRSISLETMLPRLELPNVRFVGLKKKTV
jgi:hypothetical protein